MLAAAEFGKMLKLPETGPILSGFQVRCLCYSQNFLKYKIVKFQQIKLRIKATRKWTISREFHCIYFTQGVRKP